MTSETARLILEIKDKASKPAKDTASSLNQVEASSGKAKIALAAVAAGAVAAAAAFVEMRSEVAASVDEVNTLSEASGLSRETINGLKHAARSTGKQLSELVPLRLSKNMFAVQRGATDMADAFEKAGVEVLDANGELRDADVVFRELIDSLGAMENRTLAAGLAAATMGNQGRQMLSAFDNQDGLNAFVAQASHYGIRVGPDAVRETSAWQKEMGLLSLAVDDAKQNLMDTFGGTFLLGLVRAFTWAITFMSTFFKENMAEWASDLQLLIDFTTGAVDPETGKRKVESLADAFQKNLEVGFFDIVKRAADRASGLGADIAIESGLGGDNVPFYGPLPGPEAPASKTTKGKGKDPVEKLQDIELDGQAMMDAHFQKLADQAMAQYELEKDYEQLLRDLADLQAQAPQLTADWMARKFNDLSSIRSVEDLARKIPVYGEAIAAGISFARDMDKQVQGLMKDIFQVQKELPGAYERLMTKVLPKFMERLFAGVFSGRMVVVIAKGIVEGIPRIIGGIIKGFARAIKEALNFLRGGSDRNVLTGENGKWLGTSFKKGKVSFLGFFNNDGALEKNGKKGGGKVDTQGMRAASMGMDRVPKDGPVYLHKGEKVIPAHRAGEGGGVTITGPIHVHGVQDARAFLRELKALQGTYNSGQTITPEYG